MTPADVLPPVVDVHPSWCEDGLTMHIWYTLADGRQALATYTLDAPIGQAQTPPRIIEGM